MQLKSIITIFYLNSPTNNHSGNLHVQIFFRVLDLFGLKIKFNYVYYFETYAFIHSFTTICKYG